MSSGEDAASAYDELVERLAEITDVRQTRQLLDWDRLVTMPEEGSPPRNRQQSTLTAELKRRLADERVGELLAELDGEDLDDDQRAVVREARRTYEKNARSPERLENALRKRLDQAGKFWKKAQQTSDFGEYVPLLEEIVQVQRERAAHLDPDGDVPDVLFEAKTPYVEAETARRIFDHLLAELVPLRNDLLEAGGDGEYAFQAAAPYPAAEQETLNRAALEALGFDWDRGRFDAAPHAFSCGNPFDVRIATRYDETDPTAGLLTTLHEFGHAAYTFGLPEEHYGTPLGSAMEGPVHESQSILWENHVGRSRAFWDLFLPELTEAFPELEGLTAEEAYRAVNGTYTDGLTYVEGKELTLHVNNAIRHRMERACYELEDLGEIPDVLAEEMETHLGTRPETDAAFRNAPWPKGFFGFEPYTIGAVIAAQLYATASAEIDDLDGKIRRGEFGALREWLVENVYRHGRRYTTSELIERATGEPIDPGYYVDYVEEKYGDLQ